MPSPSSSSMSMSVHLPSSAWGRCWSDPIEPLAKCRTAAERRTGCQPVAWSNFAGEMVAPSRPGHRWGSRREGGPKKPCRLRPMAFTAHPHPRPGVKFRPLGPKNLRTDSGKPRQGVKCRPLGPKNLRTGNGKLARPQRRLCQTICKIYPARTLVALLWVVAHRHHPRLVGGGGAQWDSLTAILQYDRSCCLTDLELSVA